MPRKLYETVAAEIDNAFLNTKSWTRVIKRVEYRRKKVGD
jgi:hypothetical protein